MSVRPNRQSRQARPPHARRALGLALLACAVTLASAVPNAWSQVSETGAVPAASPASAVPASVASSAAAPMQYVVQPGESVTDIAEKITGSDDRTTRNRMAAALFKANPGAFMGNDPDRLKIGATLIVPGAAATPLSASASASASVPAAASVSAAEPGSVPASGSAAATVPVASAPAVPLSTVSEGEPTVGAPGMASGGHGRVWSGSIQASGGTGAASAAPAAGLPGSMAAGAMGSSASPSAGEGAAATPAVPTSSSSGAVHGTVSSLQQLLALKNRALAALEKRGAGASAASAGTAVGGAASGRGANSAAGAASISSTSAAGRTGGISAPAAGAPGSQGVSWLASLGVAVLVLLGLWWASRRRQRRPPVPMTPVDPAPAAAGATVSSVADSAAPRPAQAEPRAPGAGAASAPSFVSDADATAQASGMPDIYPEASRQTRAEAAQAVDADSQAESDGALPPQSADLGRPLGEDDALAALSLPEGGALPMPDAVRNALDAIDLSLPELPPLPREDAVPGPAGMPEPTPRAGALPDAATGERSAAEAPQHAAARPLEAPPTRLTQAGDASVKTGPASVAGLGAAGFGALDLNFDLESPGNQAQPPASFSDSDIAAIARNKLDLAIEYVKLGDIAGARTLITEVIESHDAATQMQARTLLASLAALS